MKWPTPPPATPRHQQKQLKLAARELRTFAVFVLVVALAGPTLSPALAASPGQRLIGVLLVATLFGLGLMLLGRMPIDADAREEPDKR